MREGDEIYHALRSTFAPLVDPAFHIAVYYPTSDEKTRLAFQMFKEDVTYRVEVSSQRVQGAGTAAPKSLKSRRHVDEIVMNWSLSEASEILPATIAPPKDVYAWPNRVLDALRSLSARSKGRRDVAVWFLEDEVRGRVERGDDDVREVTGGDVKRASAKMLEYRAQEASEIDLFAGSGMTQALEEVEVEKEEAGGEGEIGTAAPGQWTMELTSHLRK